jgi:hypothetical protein
MATPRTMSAIEYRTLWSRLAERRALDPGNGNLHRLQQAFAAIGQAVGAVRPTDDADADAATGGLTLVSAFDWEHRDLTLSPEAAAVVARVEATTVVPE